MNDPSKKFLFDVHNFDAPDEPEEIIEEVVEDLPPPPPTFSESELEAAKAVSFSQGKQEGLAEEKNKREQEVAVVLEKISSSFQTLFANEIYREKTYEQEALKLALKMIEMMAPSLEQRLGKDAMMETISQTLKLQSKQSEIVLEVPKGYAVEIDEAIQKIWPDPENSPQYRIIESDTHENGQCALSWKDGGMVRNPYETIEKMKLELEELLDATDAPVPAPPNNDIKNHDVLESATKADVDQNDNTGEKHD